MKKIIGLLVVQLFLGCIFNQANSQNSSSSDFHTWALTPPMGWNSWDCFGPSVVESEVKANADYMAKNLKQYGWEYVVVDIRWYVDNQTTGHYNPYNSSVFIIDEYGRYLPSPKRFPSSADGNGFKHLADYVHSLGLKFGIHIMRGVPKEAVFKKLPIEGTTITADKIYSTAFECTWLQDNYTVLKEKAGAQEYYNSILKLYASWGVDYIKVDDLSRPYHNGEIEMLRNAIDQTGRPIVLSMSPGATPLVEHEHAKNHANMWRTIDDFWDNWSQLNYSFDKCAEWAPYITPGSWPDADMLPLGHLSIRGERGSDRYTNFTKEEQYTLMTLWTIFKSPLMFGGHLPDNDEFTNSLLTNPEVLQMHKSSVMNKEWFNKNNSIGWTAEDPFTADKYVALFNNEGDGFVSTKDILYRSGTVSTLTDGYGVIIDLAIPEGSTEIYLIVNDGGDNFNCDHADWINPVIYLSDGSKMDLTKMNWASATSGWNSVQLNKSISGGVLNVKGLAYSDGLGTHSRSIIKYVIPNNTVKFTAFAGLDKAGTDQGCGSTVEFMISNRNPTPTANSVDSLDVLLRLTELGFTVPCNIRDMWKMKDLGTFSGDDFVSSVPSHGASLLRVSPIGRSSEIEVELLASKSILTLSDTLEFSINVAPTGSSSKIPTGWIQVYQGDSLILNAEYQIGMTLRIPSLAIGQYTFKANYSGNAVYATKMSEERNVSVKKKDEILSGQAQLTDREFIFPNPIDQVLNLSLSENHSDRKIIITDFGGRSVLKTSIKDALSVVSIDVSDLKPGLYFLQIISESETKSVKFIKK
jgi:alpha-galactosidase